MLIFLASAGLARSPEAGFASSGWCQRTDGLHASRGNKEDGGGLRCAPATDATAAESTGRGWWKGTDDGELPRCGGGVCRGERSDVSAEEGPAARREADLFVWGGFDLSGPERGVHGDAARVWAVVAVGSRGTFGTHRNEGCLCYRGFGVWIGGGPTDQRVVTGVWGSGLMIPGAS